MWYSGGGRPPQAHVVLPFQLSLSHFLGRTLVQARAFEEVRGSGIAAAAGLPAHRRRGAVFVVSLNDQVQRNLRLLSHDAVGRGAVLVRG